MIFVKEIMSESVFTLTVENSLKDAQKLMSENAIRHIPIVNNALNVIGVISQRDVLAVQESKLEALDAKEREAREKDIKISDFYKEQVVTISPGASALKAARYIQKHKLGCLPVTEDEKLVGIITDSDFVNIAINLMELSDQTEEFDL